MSRWQGAGSLWDWFRVVLPQSDLSKIVSLGEGSTPLIKADRFAEKLGLKNVYLRLELCNPTRSFKDCQMTVAVSKANKWGKKDFGTVSSGNVGIALSAYCTNKGFNANVWVAGNVSPTKMQQIQIYGAKLFLFPNAEEHGVEFYKIFFNNMQEFCFKEGLVPMISARPINSYMIEGTKTISFEIVSELGHVPERVFISP